MNRELALIIRPFGEFCLDWNVTDENLPKSSVIIQNEIHKRYQSDINGFLLYMGCVNSSTRLSVSLNYLREYSEAFIKKLSRYPEAEQSREKTIILPDDGDLQKFADNAPYMAGIEYLDKAWLLAVWDRINKAFQDEIRKYQGTVAEFINSYSPDIQLAGRVYFHLVENKNGDAPFAFLATYSEIAAGKGKARHLPLKHALSEYGEDSKILLDLLSTVYAAGKRSLFIAELLDSGEIFHPLALTAKEAYTVLKEIAVYEKCGILCRIPDWWKNKTSRLKMSVTVGDKAVSGISMDALLDFNIRLSLGNETISTEDADKILKENEGLALIKGKWVEVDHQRLSETLEAYKKAGELSGNGNMSLFDAIRLQLSDIRETLAAPENIETEFTHGKWLKTFLEKLKNPERLENITLGKDFRAELRPYQTKGLNWLHHLYSLGLGACLADDMGLGKTVQIIALLNYLRTKQKKHTHLLIVPASLISNWVSELKRFSASLTFYIAHPSENPKVLDKERPFEKHDLVITTYGLLQKYGLLLEYEWDCVILDEAQAIKNPGTKQTKAVKKLKAKRRIALTGTPIENRLSDLWSLYDFLNPGLLGNIREFDDFTKRLKTSNAGYGKLRNIVGPFLLRRLKTDKAVISDLPEKIEMKVYSKLTKKQAVIYADLVGQLKTKLEDSGNNMARRGLILSSLMKFKQITNHPSQYTGQEVYPPEDSGKFLRIKEICETVYEKRERMIIFTQFKEIIEPLRGYLESLFLHEGLVLHGDTPVKKRKAIVDKFQGRDYIPFIILSLKAGGIGLNLTAANHVVHFDRWWNPAVENQATDRAFRIGQKNNVVVHKFITQGTVEEKIDAMIDEKLNLSTDVIASTGEKWITEMDNRQLLELFSLSV